VNSIFCHVAISSADGSASASTTSSGSNVGVFAGLGAGAAIIIIIVVIVIRARATHDRTRKRRPIDYSKHLALSSGSASETDALIWLHKSKTHAEMEALFHEQGIVEGSYAVSTLPRGATARSAYTLWLVSGQKLQTFPIDRIGGALKLGCGSSMHESLLHLVEFSTTCKDGLPSYLVVALTRPGVLVEDSSTLSVSRSGSSAIDVDNPSSRKSKPTNRLSDASLVHIDELLSSRSRGSNGSKQSRKRAWDLDDPNDDHEDETDVDGASTVPGSIYSVADTKQQAAVQANLLLHTYINLPYVFHNTHTYVNVTHDWKSLDSSVQLFCALEPSANSIDAPTEPVHLPVLRTDLTVRFRLTVIPSRSQITTMHTRMSRITWRCLRCLAHRLSHSLVPSNQSIAFTSPLTPSSK
jgi:hypothetical protein